MAKKYIIEIDAKVDGKEEIKVLAQDLDGVSTSAQEAQVNMDNLNTTTKENSVVMEKAITVSDSSALAMAQLGVAAYNVGRIYSNNSERANRWARDMMRGGNILRFFLGNLNLLAAAFTFAGLALGIFNKLLKASHAFIQSNIQAMKDWEELLVDEKAWDIFSNNLELAIGEQVWKKAEKPIRTFWTDWKTTILKNIGYVVEGMQSASLSGAASMLPDPQATKDAIKDWNRLGKESVTLADKIIALKLEYDELAEGFRMTSALAKRDAELRLREINDTKLSLTERMAALESYNSGLTTILNKDLAIQEKRQEYITASIDSHLLEGEALQQAIRLQKSYAIQIFKTKNKIEDLSIKYDELRDSILLATYTNDDFNDSMSVSEDIARRYLSILDDIIQKKEEERKEKLRQESYGDETREFSNEEEGEIDDLGDEDLAAIADQDKKRDDLRDYKEFLGEQLVEMGGMWGSYFELLKSFYDRDVKWTDLAAEDKKTIILGTAQATLNVASQLVNQLAASASQDFETQKKYQIAGATVQMLQGMVAAFAGAMQLGPIAGPIVGGILAAAVGAMGLANIAKIKSTTADTGGGVGSVDTGGAAASTAAPSFSLINPLSQGEAQVAQGVGADIPPSRAFVVSENVTSNQALDRNIKNQASI